MKYYFLFIALFCTTLCCFAQKIHRQYSFYPQENGNVYFIHPQKGFESKDTEAVKSLIYDITYLSGRDSASFTFSYSVKNVLQIDSVQITDHTGKPVYTTPANMFYVQPKRNYWQHRASIQIPYTLLEQLYDQTNPYVLSLIGGRTIQYETKPGSWKKQSGIVSKIFEVIKYNQ